MALTSSYATAAEYRVRTEGSDSGEDATILAQLTAVSRWLEQKCNTFWNIDDSVVTRIYDGGGGTSPKSSADYRDYLGRSLNQYRTFFLPDPLATTTGLVVKVDLDGNYTRETTLTINTDFWVGPYNAALDPEPTPYTFLAINPDSDTLEVWPGHKRSIEVTGKFGWPSVPGLVKEATIMVTRQLRDAQEGGAAASIEMVDQTVKLNGDLQKLIQKIMRTYGRARIPFA